MRDGLERTAAGRWCRVQWWARKNVESRSELADVMVPLYNHVVKWPLASRKSRFHFSSMTLTWHVKLGKSLASFMLQVPIFGLVISLFASAAWPETNWDHL